MFFRIMVVAILLMCLGGPASAQSELQQRYLATSALADSIQAEMYSIPIESRLQPTVEAWTLGLLHTSLMHEQFRLLGKMTDPEIRSVLPSAALWLEYPPGELHQQIFEMQLSFQSVIRLETLINPWSKLAEY